MAYFRRSSKDVRSNNKPNVHCKKHPKHQQSPGVCSLCLREKLSQLSSTSTSRGISNTMESSCSSSYISSYYSSSSASSCSSPLDRYCFTTDQHDGKGTSLSLLLISGKNALTKSRSIAFVPRIMKRKEGGDQKQKAGILSKLLRPTSSKRKEEGRVLVHSRTMREMVTSRVH